MGELKIEAVLRKVRALRALAKSSNQHEAEAAAAMAEGLIAKHRLEEAQIEQGGEKREAAEESSEPIDHERGPRKAWKAALFGRLAKHYGCATWYRWVRVSGKLSRTHYAVGRPSDVAAFRYMYAWLRVEIARLSEGEYGRSAKNAFRVGAVEGFTMALRRAKEAAEATHGAQHGGSAAMVLVGRLDEAKAALEALHPKLETARPVQLVSSDPGALARGRVAGERLHGRGTALEASGARMLGKGGGR